MTKFAAALPHGPLTRVTSKVVCVRGLFKFGPGMSISRTMTVVDSGDGLVVFNAVRLSEEGQAELDALGKVKHLVKLSDAHAIDEPYYADHYRPEVWTLPGARLGGLTSTRTLEGEGPVAGGKVFDLGGAGISREAAYYVPGEGGTLVTCDAIQNYTSDPGGASFLARVMTPLMGFKGGVIVAKMWRKTRKLSGSQVRDTLAALTEPSYAHLVTGHGPHVESGADTLVAAAIASASA